MSCVVLGSFWEVRIIVIVSRTGRRSPSTACEIDLSISPMVCGSQLVSMRRRLLKGSVIRVNTLSSLKEEILSFCKDLRYPDDILRANSLTSFSDLKFFSS